MTRPEAGTFAAPVVAAPVVAPPVVAAPVVAAIVEDLLRRRQSLAVAESLTGGLLAASLVDIPGVSRVFRGGLIVYATDLKASLAGVPAALLAQRGPVDPEVAVALARGARQRCRADWGAATTGVAGPDPQGAVAVGTVHVAVSGPGGDWVRGPRLGGERAAIRAGAVAAALDLLADSLAATAPPG